MSGRAKERAGRRDPSSREKAALVSRRWVRLTRVCNNRCEFCLDSSAHDGAFVPAPRVNSEIIDGRRAGAGRLILSGGEPTLHPDFSSFVRLGRRLGYERVQTITNGRLFSYPRFLERAVRAGLGEITFSVHGHEAAVHDELVGVKGAFDETMAGLRGALAQPGLIVNVDVCLNRKNIFGLPDLIDRCMEMGVREFDLLHIIPFGRAWDESGAKLFYDMDEAMPFIRHALELSRREDLHIWFNRFPPPYLEGFEDLIQEPHKLEDEVRGRKEEIDLFLSRGVPMSCRQPKRCRLCYLSGLCDRFQDLREAVSRGRVEVLRVTVEGESAPPRLDLAVTPSTIWLVAPDARTAARALKALPGEEVFLELRSHAGIEEHLHDGRIDDRRVTRFYASRPEDIDRLLRLPGEAEVMVMLDDRTTDHLLRRYGEEAPPRLGLAGRSHGLVTEALKKDPDLQGFFERFDRRVPVENVPACVSGRPPRPSPDVLDARMLDDRLGIDALGVTRDYVGRGFRTKSRRCVGCAHDADCEGAHINWVRAHGYGTLRPVAAVSRSG